MSDILPIVGVAVQVGAWLILLSSLFYAVTTLRQARDHVRRGADAAEKAAGYLQAIDVNVVEMAAAVEAWQKQDAPPAPERPQPDDDEPPLREE